MGAFVVALSATGKSQTSPASTAQAGSARQSSEASKQNGPTLRPKNASAPPGTKENRPGKDASVEAYILAPANGSAPRIALLAFSYATVLTQVQAVFGANEDIGRGVSNLLISQLVRDGKYRVIERRRVDGLNEEQNFSNDDRADARTAAKLGQELGVDAVIVGDVTQFGRDDQNKAAGIGHWSGYGLGSMGTRKTKAVVEVTARILDVNTGEILASATGRGESARSSTNLLGGTSSTPAANSSDMASSNFAQTILGEATSSSIANLATQIDGDAGVIAHSPPQFEAVIADVSADTLVLNMGSRAGLHVGDTFPVFRVVRVVKDPVTGRAVRNQEERVGQVTITSTDGTSATGTFAGESRPKVGDVVRRQ